MSLMAHAPIPSKPLRVLLPHRRNRLRGFLLARTRKHLIVLPPAWSTERAPASENSPSRNSPRALGEFFYMARNGLQDSTCGQLRAMLYSECCAEKLCRAVKDYRTRISSRCRWPKGWHGSWRAARSVCLLCERDAEGRLLPAHKPNKRRKLK